MKTRKIFLILIIFLISIFLYLKRNVLFARMKGTGGDLEYAQSKIKHGGERTLSDAEISQISSSLYHALLENATEDEELIYNEISKLKTDGDWYHLVLTFGIKSDNSFFKSFTGTLPQALKEYLSREELNIVKSYLFNINVEL